MYDLQFNGGRLKQLQEEMITVYSNLVNALKEAESEQEYLSGIWKGDAAEGFMKSQNIPLPKIDISMSLMDFVQCISVTGNFCFVVV